MIKRLSSTQNPAIYLRGVRHEDIKNLLEFMYLGEVNIAQEDLDSFLAVGQDLCIKGLTQDNYTSSQNHETPSQTPTGSRSRSPPLAPSKRPREPKPDRGQPQSKTLKREQLVQIKQEPQQHHEAIDIDHNVVIENANDEGNMEAYDKYYNKETTSENPIGEDDIKGRFIFARLSLKTKKMIQILQFLEIFYNKPVVNFRILKFHNHNFVKNWQ